MSNGDLSKEVRLMALDNMVYETTCKMYRDTLEALSTHISIPTDIRIKIESDIRKGDLFFQGGHESLRGMKDALGNPINVDI